MNQMKVRALMVALDEYATVSAEATLSEALCALEKAQARFKRNRYLHRAVLVKDQADRVVGRLSQIDVIRALEPRLADIGRLEAVTRLGFAPDFIKSAGERYGLQRGALAHICSTVAQVVVKDIMTTPSAGEYVTEEASLDEAIHQFVVGKHQSLLILRDDLVVGILRLSDVFDAICKAVAACREEPEGTAR
jgi:CBS domain-containing protein